MRPLLPSQRNSSVLKMKDMIMIHNTKNWRPRLFAFLLGCSVVSVAGVVGSVSAQTTTETKPAPVQRVRDSGRDPFRKYEPPKLVIKRSNIVMPPTIQERIEQYKAQKAAAMSARMAAPKPTTALLLEEIQVVGISRTPRGYAAIIEATPIKLSYVIYPGERFYNGQLVAIEDNRLVFRREAVFSDGRRDQRMELKALRAVNTVSAMSASKSASNSAKSESEKRADERPSTSEKP
jgi:hypothetical protein